MDGTPTIRETFHEFAAALNGISIVGYTSSYHLDQSGHGSVPMDIETIAERVKDKVTDFEKYLERARAAFGYVASKCTAPGMDPSYKADIKLLINDLKKLGDIARVIVSRLNKDARSISQRDLAEVAKLLYQISPLCQGSADKIRSLRQKLIDQNKYF